MEVEVRIPAALGSYTADAGTMVADGENVKEVVDNLGLMFEGLRSELVNDMGEINPAVRIYLNDEDIRYLDELNTAVHEGDIITILPVISG